MGKKTYTQKEAEEFAELYGYELLDYFRCKNKSHLFRCPKKHETKIIFRKIEIGACRECSNERMREQYRTTFKEIEEHFTKLRETYSNIELLTTRKDYEAYNGPANKFYLSYICYLCNKPKPGRFQDVKNGNILCKSCSAKQKNLARQLSYQIVTKRFSEIGLTITTTEENFNEDYENNSYLIDFECVFVKELV